MIKKLVYEIKCSDDTLQKILHYLAEEEERNFDTKMERISGGFEITFSFTDQELRRSTEKYLKHWLGEAAPVIYKRCGPFTAELKPEVVMA